MKHKVLKPSAGIIAVDNRPLEIQVSQKASFPVGRIVQTAIDWGYLLYLILYIFLAGSENTGLPRAAAFILLAPFAVGQFCKFRAGEEGRYAFAERFVSVVITVFEAVVMLTAAMAFSMPQAIPEEPSGTKLSGSYSAADISKLSVVACTGSNASHYYVYTVDMENRTAAKETYSYKYKQGEGGEYVVSETISNVFSEEKAAEFTEFCDEVLITEWNDVYMPEREIYEGLDEAQSFQVQYYGISRGGYRKYLLEYKDGSSDSTIMYDHAIDVPKDSSRVIPRIYKLLTKYN
ncbi:MAG: hypothetical protein ACI4J0_02730 [Huintestinicola sp.]|uniref:hypothetical protein n=1 Tax=Huintestinicola sp. TaxID=2981661 RepID=UPI003F08422E